MHADPGPTNTEPVAPRGVRLELVAAVSDNGVIGRDAGLPWHLPDDLKRFQKMTRGHAVIMGRQTFDTVGKPLPDRRNIVLTKRDDWNAPGAEVAHSLDDALALVEPEGFAYVLGGGVVYRLTMPLAAAIELTRVHAHVEGDTTFPAIDARDWRLLSEEHHPADDRHEHAFTYQRWERT